MRLIQKWDKINRALPSRRNIYANRWCPSGRKYASSPRWCKITCNPDIFQGLNSSVAVMWERVRTSEKLRKMAFGIQRAIAFFFMPSSSPPQMKVPESVHRTMGKTPCTDHSLPNPWGLVLLPKRHHQGAKLKSHEALGAHFLSQS